MKGSCQAAARFKEVERICSGVVANAGKILAATGGEL
jgi:hypothetical protein